MNATPRPTVVGLGEVLWDIFPDERRPGGAPANVAYVANMLGLEGDVCSRVGEDRLGQELLEFFASKNLATEYVQRDADHETGKVTIEFNEHGEPSYTFNDDNAWDNLAATEEAQTLIRRADAVCFGTLAQRSDVSRSTIQQLIGAAGGLVVYDVNLRKPWCQAAWIEPSLELAHILKLNEGEVATLTELLELQSGDLASFAAQVRERFDLELVCVTRGSQGCWLSDGRQEIAERAADVKKADPVGAGDAFTAGLIACRLDDRSLQETARFANQVAAYVASRPGAMPIFDDQAPRLAEP